MSPSGEQRASRSEDKIRQTSNRPLRVAVLGAEEVGKSALTVRYLTKRYIGEYRSDTGNYLKLLRPARQNSINILNPEVELCHFALYVSI